MSDFIKKIKEYPTERKLKKQDISEQLSALNISTDNVLTPKKVRTYIKKKNI